MSASPNVVPLKVPRLVALSLAWAWGIVAGGTGLNALIKSNQEQARLKHHVPPPTIVTINVDGMSPPSSPDYSFITHTPTRRIPPRCSRNSDVRLHFRPLQHICPPPPAPQIQQF